VIPLGEARRHVLERCVPLRPRAVPIGEARGCVAAAEVVAGEPVPSFDNTAMDGFAVRAADTLGAPIELQVVETLAAGRATSTSVDPGQAVRIMTGAPMPAGADAVVMVERTTPLDGGRRVRIDVAAEVGQHIRRAGDDIEAGAVVVRPGTVLTPAHVGVLASVGATTVVVHPRPVVGVLSTGDELVEAPAPLAPGQIRDSNRHALLALVAESGFVPVDLGLVRDDEHAIEAAIRGAAGSCDALLTSGGVSMGEFDYVKAVLGRLGDVRWMQVAIRPAKPLAFGVVGTMPVFGLPGNPVSSMVSFELFARPSLRRLMGYAENRLDRPRVRAVADEGLPRRPDGKLALLRVHVRRDDDGVYHAASVGPQGSHQLRAAADANGLALVEDGEGVPPGGSVEVMVLGDLP
jgi:molybdenum cofactor synthesis domain-containing protein